MLMTSFFAVKPQSSSAITKKEVLFAQFVAEYNLSASVADHFTDLVKVIFPDRILILAMFANSIVLMSGKWWRFFHMTTKW